MSTHTTLEAWSFTTANELLAALTDAIELANDNGHHPDTVYTGKGSMVLFQSTLTDGSLVMNLNVNVGGQ